MSSSEYCGECKKMVTDVIAHEWHYHDGAQTCWPLHEFAETPSSTVYQDFEGSFARLVVDTLEGRR